MKRLRILASSMVALATMLALVGCTDSANKSDDTGPQTTLRVALAEVTSNLDPAMYNVPANFINISGTVGYLISHPYQDFPYPDLYSGDAQVFDADTYDPELATDWKLSADGKSLTMHLRDGAKSPYGDTLTADDVVWTAQRNVALKTVGAFGMTVANIDPENPATAQDDNTVVWNLTAPSPLLMKVLAWSWFAPIDSVEAKKHATSDDPWSTKWLTEHTAFYGPYNVTEFTPGQSATLEVNPNYWDKKPEIQKITFQSVPDAGNRQQLVQRGEVDFVPDIPRSQLSSLKSNNSVQVNLQPGTRFSYLQYRAGVKPLDDQLVRQAISYAIPYDTILKDVYYDTALPAKTPGTWLANADPDASPYSYDLDKAKQLLDQAGYGDGFDVSLSYSLANPGPENEQVAILIADSLKKIGVNVSLKKPSSEAAFTTSYNAGDFQMALAGLSPGAPDAGYAVYVMGNTAGFQNFSKFSDPAFDKLSDTMKNEMDTTKRADEIQQTIAMYEDLVPATPIANPLIGMVASPKLQNIKLGTWGFPFWKYATLSD
jgi:peptide/nickel transport system substrate-binding protein